MTDPPSPRQRQQTAREHLRQALSGRSLSARELSQAAQITEREVVEHLPHLQRSLKAEGQHLTITPARCLDCNFVFQKRERLTRPGKCPVCRSTHLAAPRFRLA